ncbi:MAG: hypothetical protein KBD25_06390 [Rickettsiaceae bacterium]|nr:hypothetical protein [Rickettsiaceae bacterium]
MDMRKKARGAMRYIIGGAKGRLNVIGPLIGKLLFAVGLFNCNIDTTVFGCWVKEFLLPSLTKPTVIVMDLTTFHFFKTV